MVICNEMLSIVEKALFVKLNYKNSESAFGALRACRFMKPPVTFGCKSKVYRSQPAAQATLKDVIRQNVSVTT